MAARLQGGRFRSLNESLYTCSGSEALSMMRDAPELFSHYHDGFQQQTKSWPAQPVDVAARWLAGLPSDAVVADFGCGDARLMRTVKQVRVCVCARELGQGG
jgi:ribosomal RNA-processing protein 8